MLLAISILAFRASDIVSVVYGVQYHWYACFVVVVRSL